MAWSEDRTASRSAGSQVRERAWSDNRTASRSAGSLVRGVV